MKAIILAAGRGSRLRPFTDETPKSLLPLGDTTLIRRNVQILRRLGIHDISIVVGYLKQKFFQAFPSGVKFYVNDRYDQTDQAGSLFQARTELTEDVLIITADLFCPHWIYAELLSNSSPFCLAIEKRKIRFDNTMEKVYLKDGQIVQIGRTNVPNTTASGEFLGMTKINRPQCPSFLEKLEQLLEQNLKLQIVHVLQRLLDEGELINYIECRDPWCEVDDLAGLNKARTLLETNVSYLP